MNFGRNEEVCKLVKRIKIELNQLADLLNPSSILFDDTTWKVLFSKEFIASFTGIKSVHVKQNILHAILKLAKGQWPKHKFHGLASEVFPDVINVRLSMGFYIVWTVDVQRDPVNQIIKVWNVVSAQKLLWAVKRLENLLLTYSESYLKRCKPNYSLDTKLAIPLKWKKDDMFVWYKSLAPRKESSLPSNPTLETTDGEQTAVLESLLLMKFYCLSSDRAWQLLTSFDGSNIEFQFEVTEEEDRVLKSQWSSFVVGRSGTGKTTVITQKLLQKEQRYWSLRSFLYKDNEFAMSSKIAHPTLRQVIITVSSKLCAAIKQHITRFQRSLLGTGKDGVFSDDLEDGDVMLDEEGEDNLLSTIPNSFVDIPDESFPLVITYHKFLSMLDGSVSSPFLTLKAEKRNVCHVNSARQIEEGNSDTFDSEDESFVNEVRDIDGEESTLENAQEGLNPECIKCTRGREVNYDVFVSFYWVHFNSSLTKKFDASLVYMEIMSCIKGSIDSLESTKRRLSREKYLLKALERNSTVDASQREEIYSLYLQYEKLKQYNGDFDLCDYVWHLHYQLKGGGFLGNMIDFIYVDEVQDLNLGQICLLKYVSKNIMEGFMFAGDTAQTIAKGVSFRFEDIRSLFYREFLGIGKGCVQAKKQQVQSMLQMHQLSQNFRTHRGIIELADSVMRLILYFFPETVDRLHPEYSMILGDKPIIIKPVEDRSSIASLFGQGGTIGGMSCEFGAEQVILVRDQDCKGRIFEQIGRCGLVLTIIECKGLEFQDVLLYNFFTDSNLSQKWRVLYNYMQEKNISCGRKQSFPRFDSRIHNCLCSEFKQLYVAITRSKQRLYDEDFELQKPMLDYWNALDLVQTMELNESLVSSFQSISTCTQWKDRGTQLFNDRQYDMAMLCFERAGDMYRKHWCEAAFCQQIGERKLGVDPKDAVFHLNTAVEIYKSLGKFEMAAKCLIKMKDFKQAGAIYQDLLNPPKLEEAGDCFAEAKCWNEAADAYGRACSVQKCLSICGHVRLWEKGRMFIELWQDQWSRSEAMYEKELRGKIDESAENMKIDFLKRAAQYYHRMKDMHSMMKFVNMFPKTSLKRIFLSRRDHHQELMQVEIIAKNYKEASKVAEQMGNLELAAEMLEQDGSYVEGASKLVKHVRLEMLWGNDNKGWPLRPCDGAHLLTKAKGLAKGDLKLLNEIRVLEASDAIIVQLLENYKVTRELNDGLVEIIVLHQLLDESIRSYTSGHSAILGPLLVDKCLDLQIVGPIDSLQLVILIWNQWYSKVSSLIKALVKLQKKPNVSGDEMLLGPCFGYLGVTPISGAEGMGFVNVDNCAAYWLQKDELPSLSNQGKRAKVTIKRVSILAKEFWASQMVATGIECARLLEGRVDGNASVNDQCQLILKVIDIYTKLLDLEVMKKTDTDFSQEKILSYRLKLYDRIFLKACGTFEMCELREDGRVAVHLEKLLEGFLGSEGPGAYEELGCLEILLPYLSRVSLEMIKNKTIKMVCGGQASDLQSLIKFYLQNWINFYANFHEVSCCSCYFFGSTRNPGNALNDIFSMYSVKLEGYITPAAFIYLFERAFVVTYACLSHFEDLIISSKIVIDHMTGKRQEIMYSMMLKMSCDGGHQAWVKGLSALVGMGTYLLTRGNELLEWLKYSNVMEELPNVVFRLIRILAIMYMDTRNVNEHANIFQGLAHIFIERSPILEGLPDEFRRKIQIAFDKSMTDSRLRSMFAEAMKLVGDPFVILRKRGKPRIRNTRMQIVFVEIENGKFSLSRLKTKQLQDSKEKDRKLENETNEDEKVDTNEDHKEDTDEDQKEDNYQVADLSIESSATVLEESLKPSMQPWYIFVDDRKLAWFIGWRLKRKLRLARDRLQEDDSVRIARLTFSRMGCNNSQYVDTFVAQVCPLKVSFEEFLTEMNAQIQVMKATRDDLLDEMAEFQEESGSVLELLSSSHPGHRQFDVAWLESQVIRPAKLKLEEGKKTFGSARELQPIQEQKSKEAAHKKSQNKRAKKKTRK